MKIHFFLAFSSGLRAILSFSYISSVLINFLYNIGKFPQLGGHPDASAETGRRQASSAQTTREDTAAGGFIPDWKLNIN